MSGIICPKCGRSNVQGSLFCQGCYTVLEGALIATAVVNLDEIAPATTPDTAPADNLNRLNPNAVVLSIGPEHQRLVVLVTQEAVLGRLTPNQAQPIIDLSEYRAFENGVSRRHALFKRTAKGLTIQDMGSSNGTWLNGTLLGSFQPYSIVSGDHLRLSLLDIMIYLP